MKNFLLMTAVAALSMTLAAPMAMAHHEKGHEASGPPTERELAERRCGNNGGGNDGELLLRKKVDGTWVCRKNWPVGEESKKDVDPN